MAPDLIILIGIACLLAGYAIRSFEERWMK